MYHCTTKILVFLDFIAEGINSSHNKIRPFPPFAEFQFSPCRTVSPDWISDFEFWRATFPIVEFLLPLSTGFDIALYKLKACSAASRTHSTNWTGHAGVSGGAPIMRSMGRLVSWLSIRRLGVHLVLSWIDDLYAIMTNGRRSSQSFRA